MDGADYTRILRTERLAAGITQIDMAHALQMAQAQYSRLERGQMRYLVRHMVAAAHRLGVPCSRLLGEGSRKWRTRG